MTQTPIICTLSAEGLRGYAAGVRAARAIAARATLFSLPAAVQQMDSEAAIAEGFADRLNAIAPAPSPPNTAFTPGDTVTVTIGATRAGGGGGGPFSGVAQANAELAGEPPYWLADGDGTETHTTIERLFDSYKIADLTPIAIASDFWDGTRWFVCWDAGEEEEFAAYDSEAEAQSFCDEALAAAQAALNVAAEDPVVLPPDFGALRRLPEPEAPEPMDDINIRSIKDLTEAEAIDLERRYCAGVESIDGISRALRISPNSVRSRATYRKWLRVHVDPREADSASPAHAPTAASSPFFTPPAANAKAPPPPVPMTTEDKAEARERLRTGAAKGARDIIDWFGCTADEAQALVDAHRAKDGK